MVAPEQLFVQHQGRHDAMGRRARQEAHRHAADAERHGEMVLLGQGGER